jgi:hypothetical protein
MKKPQTTGVCGFFCMVRKAGAPDGVMHCPPGAAEELLESFGYVAGTDTAGADLDASHGTVGDGLDFLQVRIPGSAGLVVGVAHVITETGAFSTDRANFGHCGFPPVLTEAIFYNRLR